MWLPALLALVALVAALVVALVATVALAPCCVRCAWLAPPQLVLVQPPLSPSALAPALLALAPPVALAPP